jgi:fructose-bisphosphate aldolase class II
MCHRVGVSVEGEIGVLGSLETGLAGKEDGLGAEGVLTREQMVTSPDEAAEFVKATNVDALAVAIGTSHGAYKFSKKPTGEVLVIDQIKKIHERIPKTALVMHGASSVPQELREMINQYGGQMKETYGVPEDEIVRAIKMGVRKINVDTDNRMAITAAVRKQLMEKPSDFDMRDFMRPAMDMMQKVCEERLEKFGAAGQGPKIKPATLVDMTALYKEGRLNAVIK